MSGKLCPRCGAANCRVHRKRRNMRDGYATTRWAKFQARFLETRPLCEHESGCDRRAVHVHHRDGLGPLGPRGYDLANLQPLCQPHHTQVTALMNDRDRVPTRTEMVGR